MDYDNNYIKEGYSIYKGLHVFSLSYVFGNDLACSSGQIEVSSDNLEKNEFEHSISTEQGSSGCPIILISNQMRVIGIHSSFCKAKNLNCGTYIGEIIEILKKNDIPNQENLKGQRIDKNKIFLDNTNNKNIDNKNNNKNFINNNKNTINKINLNKNIINNNSISNNNNINHDSSKQNNTIELTIDTTQKGKKDIINFAIKSMDQSLNCKISCMSSDRFNKIVNAILEKKPSFIDKVGYFLCNGDKVNEYKTIKDNGIKNNYVVLLNGPD